jgi:signal transduction histidine kinase
MSSSVKMRETDTLEGPKQQTVLIAEDDPLLAEAIAATLDLEGLETIVTHNGKEALSLARQLQPDLVLLDVMMPGRTGIEVCAALKTASGSSEIPVILVTAKSEEEDRAVGLAAGAHAYVTKPFSPVQLIDLVKETLAGESVEPRTRKPSIGTMSLDQLTVYARDLKELWQREREEREALERARERLLELDRLKAAFVSTVTHELLTPFASIGTTLAVLQKQSQKEDAKVRETLEDLSTAIAGLHRCIEGVVKFAELVNKQREPQLGLHGLDEVVPWAIEPVAMIARAREVDFQLDLPPNLSKTRMDAELVSEAVFQMAHNAVKFNRPGGKARIRAFQSDEWLFIEVSDTGIGLTHERLDTLGLPFEQSAEALRRGQEGLGIGWAFVCYVAEVHNGRTYVESDGPGEGSTFSLALPLNPDTGIS